MQAPVAVPVGVGFVPGVDNGAFHHRVEPDFRLEKIAALRDLIRHVFRPIFRPHFPGAAKDLTRHQERGKLLDNALEWRAAIHQVIFVVAVAVALLVAVVFVDQNTATSREHLVGADAAEVENPLTCLFVAQEVQHIRTFRGGEFRMGMVDVKPRPIG